MNSRLLGILEKAQQGGPIGEKCPDCVSPCSSNICPHNKASSKGSNMTYCLGALPQKYDLKRRTLQLKSYVDPDIEIPPSPERIEWGRNVQYSMFGNDIEGCCTCAAAGHAEQIWSYEVTGRSIEILDSEIHKAYRNITGGVDTGAYLLDVLKYWQQIGIAGHKIFAYAEVNPKDDRMMSLAAQWFGGVYCAYALPKSVERQGNLWTIEDFKYLKGDSIPWSLGGHCMWDRGRDPTYVYSTTWGRPQEESHPFGLQYRVEAYAVISDQDWISRINQLTPGGLDRDKLIHDLSIVTR